MSIINLNLAIPIEAFAGEASDTSNMDATKTIQCIAGSASIINIEISNDNGVTWILVSKLYGAETANVSVYAQKMRANVVRIDYNLLANITISANNIPSTLTVSSASIDPDGNSSNIDISNMSADKLVYCAGNSEAVVHIQISNDSVTWLSIGHLRAGEFQSISILSSFIRAETIIPDHRSGMYLVVAAATLVDGGDNAGHGGGGSNSNAWFNPVKFGTLNQGLDPYVYDLDNKTITFNDIGSKTIEVGYDINITAVATELNDRILVANDNDGGIHVGIYFVETKGDDETYEVWKRADDCNASSDFIIGKAVLITQEAFETEPCNPIHESVLYMWPAASPFIMDTTVVQFAADIHAVRTNSDREIYGHWRFKNGSLSFNHCGQSTVINSTATQYRTQTLPDQDGTFAMLSDINGFNEAAFRDAASNLTQTVYCNYKRFNSVGHPHPAWPHGVTTVGWTQSNFLPMLNVTEAQSNNYFVLSQVSPWQGVIAIDSNDPSGVGLPSNPLVGDIVDAVTSLSGACLLLDPGAGTIDASSGTYPMSNGDQQRLICTNATGPEWSTSSISILDFKNACVAAASRASDLSSTAGITSQKVITAGSTTADLTTHTTRLLGGWAGDNITITVPDGLHPGQQHAFVLNNPQNGKSYNIVPDNFCDGAQVILTLPFDGVVLEWDSNCSKWFVLSYSGGTTISNDI